MRDLLLKPPRDEPYAALKEQLIKRTTVSERRRLQQLLTGEELGDRKPTQLLRRMQQLLGDRPGVDPSFLWELFLQRLPHAVRIVLTSTPEGTALATLAEMADKIMEVANPSNSIAALSTVPVATHTSSQPPAALPDIEDLRSEISRLEKLVRDLTRPRPSRMPPRSPRRPSTPSSSPIFTSSNASSDATLCWYHQKFSDRARSCRSPCSWSSKDQAGH